MKTVFLTVSILYLTSFGNLIHAQEKLESLMNESTPEERAQLQTDYMKENLALTPEQEPKIHDLNLKYAKKMQDAYNTTDRRFQKLKKMKSIGDEKDQELKSVLNPDQYATYEKNKELMKEKMRARAKERQKGR